MPMPLHDILHTFKMSVQHGPPGRVYGAPVVVTPQNSCQLVTVHGANVHEHPASLCLL